MPIRSDAECGGLSVRGGSVMLRRNSTRAPVSLRLIGAALASLVAFTLTFAITSSADRTAAAGDCTADPSYDSEETAFMMLINNHRIQNGLPVLQTSETLSKAAQWKSNDMGARAYFAHDDGWRTWVQRLRDCGYGYNAWLGENIAAGVSSAQAAFDLWKNSPGHNANMLGANYTAVGVGRAYVAGSPYGWYWTTEFASINDGWPSGTPTPTPPQPTNTPVPPTATPTRTPAPTATTAPSSVHVADLDASTNGKGARWTARVTVTVHGTAHQTVAGAIVSGRWNGATNTFCTTDSAGRCTLQLSKVTGASATLAVTGVSKSGATYDAAANHDVDGGSNGTTIAVSR